MRGFIQQKEKINRTRMRLSKKPVTPESHEAFLGYPELFRQHWKRLPAN